MPDSLSTLVLAPLIIALAYTTFGMAGFGSSLVASPLLAILYGDLRFVLPVVVLIDSITAVSSGLRYRDQIHRGELFRLLPFLLCGVGLGFMLLLHLPMTLLQVALGAVALIFGAMYTLGGPPSWRLPAWAVLPIGLVAGVMTASLGVAGPLYVMYLASRGVSADSIRATIPAIFIFTILVRGTAFVGTGLITNEVLWTAALLLPVAYAFMLLGRRLHARMGPAARVRVIGLVVVLSGVSLLVRALFF